MPGYLCCAFTVTGYVTASIGCDSTTDVSLVSLHEENGGMEVVYLPSQLGIARLYVREP
jgi:hypothetical protein